MLTGDLSQDESGDSYEHLYDIIKQLASPIYYIPGNHDKPSVMFEHLSINKPLIKTDKSFSALNWQIILLNSIIEGSVEGYLSALELERLDNELKACAGKHVLISLHHQPVPIGAEYLDCIGLQNQKELFEVIDKHRHVKVVLWGHIHQEFCAERDGILLIGTPSTCFQFKPRVADFALDEVPPGYRSIRLYTNGTVATTVHRVHQKVNCP